MEAFFWSLALAAVSALTFVAYKHPQGFARNIFPRLIGLTSVFLVAVIARYIGSMESLTESLPREVAKATESLNILQHIADSIVDAYVQLKYSLLGVLVVFVYLNLLRFLPSILGIEHEKSSLPSGSKDD
jgi:hypothetical protein